MEKLTEQESNHVENSQTVRIKVQKARDRQNLRYHGTTVNSNAELTNKTFKQYCELSDDYVTLLRKAVSSLGLSGRSYYRLIKLSRTIADLTDEEHMHLEHVAQALQYRPKVEII
ncbi:MAG: hypothetical protein ACR2LN_04960 [Candidatus Levyibacteriota bacterium]